MDDGPEREAIIRRMRDVAVEDCPWIFLDHDDDLMLANNWLANVKPHPVANDSSSIWRVDGRERARMQAEWNKPNYWPAIVIVVLLIAGTLPAVAVVRKRRNRRVRVRPEGQADAALSCQTPALCGAHPGGGLADHLPALLRHSLAGADGAPEPVGEEPIPRSRSRRGSCSTATTSRFRSSSQSTCRSFSSSASAIRTRPASRYGASIRAGVGPSSLVASMVFFAALVVSITLALLVAYYQGNISGHLGSVHVRAPDEHHVHPVYHRRAVSFSASC